MKKKIINQLIYGFPTGVAIGHLFSILFSLIFANGNFYPCAPQLITSLGNEINAIILQTVLCGLLGSVFAASSIIWKLKNWNIVKQTGIYFLITASALFAVAYILNWMEHSFIGFLKYASIFIIIFIIVWITQFFISKHNVKLLNDKLNNIK